MNAGKRGHPFQYPDLFIQWMASIYLSLHVPYRQDGRIHPETLSSFRDSSLPTMPPCFRRIRDLDLSLQVNPELLSRDVIVVVDPTGIKVTNRGE